MAVCGRRAEKCAAFRVAVLQAGLVPVSIESAIPPHTILHPENRVSGRVAGGRGRVDQAGGGGLWWIVWPGKGGLWFIQREIGFRRR